ncbi:hypothetical protein IEQ34_014515 [Dendrobium chrysotoxum]|uniref:DNA-directed RNA polymerase II subunit RPB9-like zinc ribbon domain-containing protein n=1 Tax=Dendrobium chrysotoxum TaxID=161865 RepID=A0AAV7GLW2_DENCH|nr:hypothetical protein IEQ34_014515 [Dendrobium chrysotoxum]
MVESITFPSAFSMIASSNLISLNVLITFNRNYINFFECLSVNNLLYPREDKKQKIELSACRTCSYTEVAESNRVYRNEITQTTERPLILRDAYADPTLPREKGLKCPVCNHPHVAFFLVSSSLFIHLYIC